jgi:phosphoribosylaminoimidazolecarboxamide formyltransferase/IMP cyclohydrolase
LIFQNASSIPIRRALLSVSDKTGLIEFAQFLALNKVELLATGGTATQLRSNGIPTLEVSDYTGFPEILDGRVKTLHPKIHGGLLAVRTKSSHRAEMQAQGIEDLDLVVLNLYPFREVSSRKGVSFEDVIEQIDIGGPSMVRSAAKNHLFVAVVTDPRDYGWIRRELETHAMSLTGTTRFILAQKAFATTASYDAAIATYLAGRVWSDDGPKETKETWPELEVLPLERVQELRYGENPHQRAALYRRMGESGSGVAGAEVLHGKELSYNNLIDADAAWNLILEFDQAAAAVIKHTNPSGVAQAGRLRDAYIQARDCDPVSAFGSVVALNREVDGETAAELSSTFVEVILAPDFSPEALEVLTQKKNLRLLRMGAADSTLVDHRQISGGFLAQHKDLYRIQAKELKTVTRRAPTSEELEALLFGWRVVKHVKSNAVVFSSSSRTLGIGAGQMSRVDSVKWGAQRATLPLQGSAMASDGFFPFPDGIVAAAGYGVRAVIQPGGSVRDSEVVDAADAHDMAMVFTGIRHFKH